MNTPPPPDTLDLFAGPGGWSQGLRTLGITDIGIEWDPAACRTRAAAGHLTVRADVSQLATEPMRGRIRRIIDSSPCQPWSRAGKGLGLQDQPLVHQALHDLAHGRDTRAKILTACKDQRSLLAAEPMRYLHDLRPDDIVKEEVPDVLPLFRHYAEILRGWGYSTWTGILNAADYGVPQTRRRAILTASRVRTATAPPPTHDQHPADDLFGDALQPWVSMAQALGWTDGLVVNTRGERTTPGGNEFPADEPAQTLVKSTRSWVLRSGQSVAGEGRATRGLDTPAVTITSRADLCAWTAERPATTVCATNRIAPPGHRDRSSGGESQFASPDTVRITVQEAALLQSFPADYPWQGSRTKQFEQIGNAVPPRLAMHVCAAAFGLELPAPTPLLATAA